MLDELHTFFFEVDIFTCNTLSSHAVSVTVAEPSGKAYKDNSIKEYINYFNFIFVFSIFLLWYSERGGMQTRMQAGKCFDAFNISWGTFVFIVTASCTKLQACFLFDKHKWRFYKFIYLYVCVCYCTMNRETFKILSHIWWCYQLCQNLRKTEFKHDFYTFMHFLLLFICIC